MIAQRNEEGIVTINTGEDTYWFYVVMHNNYPVWHMFNDSYSFEVKRIV